VRALALLKTGRIEGQQFKLVDIEEPKLRTDEVLVRINEVGLCRLDLELIEGNYMHLGYPSKLPLILGHEILGKVEEVGDEVKYFRKYENVGIGPIYSACLRCENCLDGKENLCEKLEITGISCDGGLTQYIKINENFLFKVPEDLNKEATTILCSGAIAYKCLKEILNNNSEKIGIFGNDIIGIILSQMLKYYGIETHIVLGRGEINDKVNYYDNALQAKDLKANFFDTTVILYHNPELIEKSISSLKKGGNAIVITLGITKFPTIFECKNLLIPGLPTRLDINETIKFFKRKKIEIKKEEIEIKKMLEGLRKIKLRNTYKKLFLNVQKILI
jgi:Zn-dependent alcohol dehydrogenases